jgi:DNA modification methylase
MSDLLNVLRGDCREVLPTLPDQSVQCVVTSPPYYALRSYGADDHPEKAKEIGLEATPQEFIRTLVHVFREVRRVLRDDGTLWLNMGDGYASSGGSSTQGSRGQRANRGHPPISVELPGPRHFPDIGVKPKDMMGMPWRLAFALQEDGWYLRQDIIWHKPNPMPESVRDRCTKAHEYVFLMSKSERYYSDFRAICEPSICDGRESVKRGAFNGKTNALNGREAFRAIRETRNRRSVWTIPSQAYSGAHFATFPEALVLPCILAGCPAGGVVLDPFGGSGTVGRVAIANGRRATLIELYEDHIAQINQRTTTTIGFALGGVE